MEFNLAEVNETVARTVPERPCIVDGTRRTSYGEFADRTRRLARVLAEAGLGCRRERAELPPHASGQDHLACFLHNGTTYLESMVGACKARVAACNINYRYVANELRDLLRATGARAIVFHSALAPTLAEVLEDLPPMRLLLQVADDSGVALLPGALWYEDALAAATGVEPAGLDPDDLYLLCTGGTTGQPRTVLWRQADVFCAAMGGRQSDVGEEWPSLEAIADAARLGGARLLPAAPLMHGAAQWLAFSAFTGGHTLVLAPPHHRFDADQTLGTIQAERVNVLMIVGDAFARMLVEALDHHDHDLSSLTTIVSGGAPLSVGLTTALLDRLELVTVVDGLGASETGAQAAQVSAIGAVSAGRSFRPTPWTCILSDDRRRLLGPDEAREGWLAQRGRVPLGYLDDPQATAERFPVIDGERVALSGDRARWTTEGTVELLGREATTICSGGEKVFAEEVEAALREHDAVQDVAVVGAPSQRWGTEVVALVQLDPGREPCPDDLLASAGAQLARYKLPKRFIFVDAVRRHASGKLDYAWAGSTARAAPSA